MSKIFNGILKTMSGGPIVVTDPVTGARREVPQTKSQMGRAIVAAALAGLMTPNQYRDTPYGPVRDSSNTASAAMAAGAQATEKRQQQAQQLTNDQQSAKLMTVQNNAKLVQQAAAMAHQKHEVLADTVARNQETFMKPLLEFDKNRPADMPDSIFLNKGMTSQEVFDSGHSLSDNNVIIDGMTTKPNPQTGVLEDEPTYAIINNKANLKLPKEVTDELGKFNKGYAQAYDLTGGNVVVPINAYMDAVHTANTLTSAESFLNRAQQAIDPKAKGNIDLAAAYKQNPTGLQPAIDSLEKALAAGQGNDREGGSVDNVIRSIRATPNGSQLLSLLGKPEDIDKWIEDTGNARLAAQARAKAEGKIAEQKAKPITFAAAPSIANDESETPERRVQAQKVIAENLDFKTKEAAMKAQFAATKANPNMMTGSLPDGTQIAGTQDELTKAGATGVTKLPAADSSKVSVARQLIARMVC